MKMKRMICSIGIVSLVLGLANFVMAGEEPKMGRGGKESKSIQATPPAPKVIYQKDVLLRKSSFYNIAILLSLYG